MAQDIIRTDQFPVLIIPAYEPGISLIKLVERLREMGAFEIYVVNDGSSPDKKNIFDQIKGRAGVTIIEHAINLGKGIALKSAFNRILLNHPNTVGAVTVDADGQHLPEDVEQVASELLANQESLVLGARGFSGKVPLRSAFGNKMTGVVFHFLIGKCLSDTQTGLRGIPRSFMRQLLSLSTARYEFELDMLILAVRNGVPIIEVPIQTIYEEGNKSSHFNPFLDSFRIYFVFLRFTLNSLLSFAVDWVVFSTAYFFTREVFLSVALGRLSAAPVSFAVSRAFVFKSNKDIKKTLLDLSLLWGALYLISYALTMFFYQVFHFNVYTSRLVVDSTLFVFNFAIQRVLIFGAEAGKTAEKKK